MNKLFIDDNIDFHNKNVLIRVDFNVPINYEKNYITNNNRINSALPTIDYLIKKQSNNIVIITHLGRPKGKVVPELTLKLIKEYLEKKLNKNIILLNLDDYLIKKNKFKNEVILIENIRFHPEEERNSNENEIMQFENKLSQLADIFVNDAFGSCHRNHCSIMGKGYNLKLGGLLLKSELKKLDKVMNNVNRPFSCIIGGAKVHDKIKLIYNLIDKVDNIIIGGGMAFTFLKVLYNMEIGDSLFDEEGSKYIIDIMKKANEKKVKIVLPEHFLCGDSFSNNAKINLFTLETGIASGYIGLDIGIKSIIKFEKFLNNSKTILWNGPIGVFEFEKFSSGSKVLIDHIRKITDRLEANVVIGGGDTANCAQKYGLLGPCIHISTGGGATLTLLEGSEMPGIKTLSNVN